MRVESLVAGSPFLIAGAVMFFDLAGILVKGVSPQRKRLALRFAVQVVLTLGIILLGMFAMRGQTAFRDPFALGIAGTLCFYQAYDWAARATALDRAEGTHSKRRESTWSLSLLAGYLGFLGLMAFIFWKL